MSKTKVPDNYILFHEAWSFVLGNSCEKVDVEYLLNEIEAEFLELYLEKKKLTSERDSNSGFISSRELELETAIDERDEYSASSKRKHEQHKEIRGFFYGTCMRRLGMSGCLQARFLHATGALTEIVGSFYTSQEEFDSACDNSNIYMSKMQNNPAAQVSQYGQYILKQSHLDKYSQKILHELRGMKAHFNMTDKDMDSLISQSNQLAMRQKKSTLDQVMSMSLKIVT